MLLRNIKLEIDINIRHQTESRKRTNLRDMNKLITQLLSALILILWFSTYAFAQPKLAAGADPEGTLIGCADLCVKNMVIEVPIANLHLYAPQGNGDLEYFPRSLPRMYLRTTILGEESIVLLKRFVYRPEYSNHVPVFVATTNVSVNVCDICGVHGTDINSTTVFMELLTLVDGRYRTYPACTYTAQDEIFSCLMVSSLNCNNIMCDEDQLTKSEQQLYVYCGPDGCTADNPNGAEDDNEKAMVILSEIDINILQSPVSNTLTITTKDPLGAVEITIVNTSGQVVKRQTTNKLINRLDLDVSDHPQGLYYMHVSHGLSRTVKSYIKQ